MKKRIAILGSTGSIGQQALNVIYQYAENFEVVALTTNRNVELLAQQVKAFHPSYVGIVDTESAREFGNYGLSDTEVISGKDCLVKLATLPEVDLVLVAVVGIAGLEPTIAALEAGKNVALANKESLVAGGHLVMEAARKSGSRIIPVDSEHSAIFQCMAGCDDPRRINRVYLTASGGPFRNYTKEDLRHVTVNEALNHPNWKMGKKVTIDSATLMNKGLEVIEAHWLFGLSIEQIKVVIHPQSIVHSMVEYIDGSIIAQMGKTDMRLPILYALSWPERLESTIGGLDLAAMEPLTFEMPDFDRFPCLALAYKALEIGGTMPAVLNAADEVAVEKFLKGEISFMEIPVMIEQAMKSHKAIQNPDLNTILRVDHSIRRQLM
ncbi:MAG: 1-deoxy-D-xylulose-5-phosphate reductoisomerase [Caldicoprobacter oshimai]|uniref:1-deoxy-D-xylulose 5-phosphate reductoisomerase n=1 Tax=Caldicoprobacter faecalis TaxID=937334 RepID=A0A1I5RPZ7_9FIRM|nr:1-deoxy-D-xylulose-5-phosphate reductoisomerase [Caldicoprobacter faecalis]PZN10843.1 MAG: 1-deoxy-D-xylulose-5-phosphate reductoisomerase [Caldicoprobacter oshimai]SFP60573.1 1-deoxy-D-xylulose 5-phosphate reductoisomerase [Caldicoprobacter faecalis]